VNKRRFATLGRTGEVPARQRHGPVAGDLHAQRAAGHVDRDDARAVAVLDAQAPVAELHHHIQGAHCLSDAPRAIRGDSSRSQANLRQRTASRSHIFQDHFDPTMVALGSFSGNAHRIVQRYPQRGYRINVVASFDTEAARATCTKRLATSIRALLA
jgi:hypothetical protein